MALQVGLGLGRLLLLLAASVVAGEWVGRLSGQVLDEVIDLTSALVFAWRVLRALWSEEDGWESETNRARERERLMTGRVSE